MRRLAGIVRQSEVGGGRVGVASISDDALKIHRQFATCQVPALNEADAEMIFSQTFPAAVVGFLSARHGLVLNCLGIPALPTVAEILVQMASDQPQIVGAVFLLMPMACLSTSRPYSLMQHFPTSIQTLRKRMHWVAHRLGSFGARIFRLRIRCLHSKTFCTITLESIACGPMA